MAQPSQPKMWHLSLHIFFTYNLRKAGAGNVAKERNGKHSGGCTWERKGKKLSWRSCIETGAWSLCLKTNSELALAIKNKPMKTPTAAVNSNISKPLQKRSPLSKVKVQNIKRKNHLEPLSGALKTSGGTFKFKLLHLNIELCFWKLWTFMFDLYLEPLWETFEPWCGTLIWNLCAEPLCEAFIRNLHDKPFCETFIYVEPWCGTSGTWIILWNLSLEPWNLYLWNLGTCKRGTFILGNLTLYVEPELLRVEHLCGTLGNPSLYLETFQSATCMWTLGESELLRVEPLCGTLGKLNF